jgi:uncharacterized membrane protein YecN with MAPEG domain
VSEPGQGTAPAKTHNIVGRAEFVLIAVMVLGFLLIAQQWSFAVYQVGLLTVMAATVLNIAVGNLPRNAGPGRALGLTLFILAIVAAVFAAGISLVPYLAQLGS